MNGDLADVAFMARSENRIEILQLLAAEPRTRKNLRSETEASRVTVDRILAEFDRRGWIVSTEADIRTTAVGRGVASELSDLRDTLQAADVLGPLASSLPPDFMTIDVCHFRNAELITAHESDPFAVARVAADLMDDADRVHILATAVTSDTVDAQIRATREDDQISSVVLTTDTVSAIRDDERLAERLRIALTLEGISVFETDSELPLSMGIYDDETIGLGVIGDSAIPTATLLSTNETVLSWARETFDRYCDGARALHHTEFDE